MMRVEVGAGWGWRRMVEDGVRGRLDGREDWSKEVVDDRGGGFGWKDGGGKWTGEGERALFGRGIGSAKGVGRVICSRMIAGGWAGDGIELLEEIIVPASDGSEDIRWLFGRLALLVSGNGRPRLRFRCSVMAF